MAYGPETDITLVPDSGTIFLSIRHFDLITGAQALDTAFLFTFVFVWDFGVEN